jgi:exosortase A
MSRVLHPLPTQRSLTPAWRACGLALALALLALLVLYRDTGMAMVQIWERSDTFAHAFIVPPISAWLIWRQRAALAALQPRPDLWFALPLALCAFAWLVGDLAAVNALTQLSFVAMLVLLVPLLLGRQVAWQMVFPLGFLFFCVPIGEFMMPQLMETTADFTVAALRLTGIPVFREGQQFIIPSGTWSVVEACSGLRYLMASVMVGTLFAYLNYQTTRRRLIFVGVAIVLPLVANWVRAYLIVMLGHLSGNELATGADHLVYGWVFFGIIMLLMFMVGARFADDSAAPDSVPVVAARPAAPVWPAPLLALLLLAGPHLALGAMGAEQGGVAPRLGEPALPGWTRAAPADGDWRPVFLNPAAEQHAVLEKNGQHVGLHIAYYRQQGYDSKLISSSNQLVRSDDKQWVVVRRGGRPVTLGQLSLPLRSAELRGSADLGGAGNRLVVWQFYWINGHLTASDARAKAYGVLERLLGHGDDAAAVTLYTPKPAENEAAAEAVLQAFLQTNWAALNTQLEQARAAANAAPAKQQGTDK